MNKNRPHSMFSFPPTRARGLSLIEVITVLAIIAILSLAALVNLTNSRNRLDLDNTAKQMTALLREAQSRSAAQEEAVAWGVHFENSASAAPFYSIFKTAYSASNAISHYRLPVNVAYSTSSIAQGAYTDVTFSQISGLPSAAVSVTINLMRGGAVVSSSTVSVSSSGLISF